MTNAPAPSQQDIRSIDSSLMMKVFYGFAVLALLSLAISAAGKWFGHSIAMAGHTDDATQYEIVIGNDVVSAPANAIRFERSRRDGSAERLDLYLHWPDLKGYGEAMREDFNHTDGSRHIVFLSFEPRMMSRDMSGRFAPIYSSLIVSQGKAGPSGIMFHDFTSQSGYLNEVLAVADRPGQDPFVARCLSGASAEESLAPCERDIQIGENLSVSYRFPLEFLDNWKELDAAIRNKTAGMLKTAH